MSRWSTPRLSDASHLDIYYSADGGSRWDTVSLGETNDSSYAWVVPPPLSDSCLVRIIAYDLSLNPGQDESDSLFRISDRIPPQVVVVAPNGGEDWGIGEVDTIRWIATDVLGVDSLSILYSTDDGSTWDTVSSGEPNDSTYFWTVPNTPSDSCLMWIVAYDPSLNPGEDMSDSLFRISDQTPPQVTIIAPNGGEDWAVGEEDTISWTAYDQYGVDSVDIYYSINGGSTWDTVSTGEPNDSSYTWTVPPTPSDSCLVRVVAYDPSLNQGLDDSDSLFTISDQTPPQVTVIAPNGGENWSVGEVDTIRWEASDNLGVDHLDIYYSADGGSRWDTVSLGETNDSSYGWVVPNTPSESCLVRVVAYDSTLNQSEDLSDSLFTIYLPGIEELLTELPVPRTFALFHSYPNPFTQATTVPYRLTSAVGGRRTADNVSTCQLINLSVYDVAGRRIRTLVDGNQPAGHYRTHWDGRDDSGADVASGLYLLKLHVSPPPGGHSGTSFTACRKIARVR